MPRNIYYVSMKYLRYSLIGLAAIALVSVIVVTIYAIFYFREKSTMVRLQNDAAVEQASLMKPSISLDGISCDIASDAKIQYYSIDIRTSSSNITNKQRQVENKIKVLGGTIVSTNQAEINDKDAGYGNSVSISGYLPWKQADNFISQIKNDIILPDYLSYENNFIQDGNALKHSCQINLGYLKDLISTESLYLSQLNSDQETDSDKSYIITDLADVKQKATEYKNAIENTTILLNKVQVNIAIKQIPG